ncbi:MAG: glycohydrolase toxin TNT-related protein, partial [Idiomarina sp.]|nr:glycohydrolase toxin TNT-related protein [Idiomarina sp.]
GEITIRDEDAQRAREEAGETRDVAALNRDLDMARETLRDERAGVRFYASDSAVRELASGFAQTRQNIAAAAEILSQALEALSPEDRARAEEIAENLDPEADAKSHGEKIADDLVEENGLSEEDRDAIAALVGELLLEAASDPEVAAQLNACIAPGRQGFNLHDLLFPRAYAEAAAICPQQLAEIGARYGANVLRGAALGATSAAAFLTALLYPSGSFGDMTVERIEGVDGSVIEIRNQPGESSAVMTATDAGGNQFAFDMVRTSDGYVVVGGYQRDGLGGLVPISPRQAIDIAGTLFGQGNEGFTEHRNDGMTVITPAANQLPLIFVTPPVQQEGVTLATPANPQQPLDLITTAPDLGWVTAWESRRLDVAHDLGVDPQWVAPDGTIRWPPNDGFAAEPERVDLPPGTLLDRYGAEGGRFLAPAGTPFEARAMPPSSRDGPLTKYEVLRPLPVDAGPAASWFDQPGGGKQFLTDRSVSDLIRDGYIRRLP